MRGFEDFYELAKDMGLNGVYAEVGVCDGKSSMRWLSKFPMSKMLLVDSWDAVDAYTAEDGERNLQTTLRNLAPFPQDKYEILRMTSLEAAALVPDGALDFICTCARAKERKIWLRACGGSSRNERKRILQPRHEQHTRLTARSTRRYRRRALVCRRACGPGGVVAEAEAGRHPRGGRLLQRVRAGGGLHLRGQGRCGRVLRLDQPPLVPDRIRRPERECLSDLLRAQVSVMMHLEIINVML